MKELGEIEEKQNNNVIRTRIIELEEKLMDVIELSSRYEYIPVPIFEEQMSILLKEIEYLESLNEVNCE